jgi:hypothetical protein
MHRSMRQNLHDRLKRKLSHVARTEQNAARLALVDEQFEIYREETGAGYNLRFLDGMLWYISGIMVGMEIMTDEEFARMYNKASKAPYGQ